MARNNAARKTSNASTDVKTIRRQGGSLTVGLTQQFEAMGLSADDQVFIVKTPTGIELTKYDPHFAKTVDAARQVMKRFPNALKELAK